MAVQKLQILFASTNLTQLSFLLFQKTGQVYDPTVCHCVFPASRTFLNSFYTLGKIIFLIKVFLYTHTYGPLAPKVRKNLEPRIWLALGKTMKLDDLRHIL